MNANLLDIQMTHYGHRGSRPSYSLHLFLMLSLIFANALGGTITSSINIASRVINVATTYTFTLNLQTALSDTCKINFIFPASSGITLPTSPTCTKGTGFNSNPTCTKLSSTTIQLACSSGIINSLTFPVYVVTIGSFTNPSSAKTISNIQIQTYSGTTLLDSTSSAYAYFTPVTIASSMGSFSSATPTVGKYAALTATLKISNPVPASGQIIIGFPKWEQLALGAVNPGTMIDQVVSCSSALDISGNDPICVGDVNSDVTLFDTVTVTNALTSTGTLAAGKSLSITLTNIRNPPTLKPYTTFYIYTADSLGNLIEKCTGLTLTLTTKGTLDSSSAVVLEGNTGINQLGTYRFYIKTTNPVPMGGFIQITMPSEVSGDPSTLTLTPVVFLNTGASITRISSTTFNIVNGFISSSDYVLAGYIIGFTLYNIKNPSTSYKTSSFSITTYDESSYGIETLSTGLTIQAAGGSLSSVSIYPTDLTGILQMATTYYVSFKVQNPLDTTATIVMSFPTSSFEMRSGTCTISGLNTGYSCTTDRLTQILTITNFLDSSISASSTVKFTISNLQIRNPPTTRGSSAISIYTTSQSLKMDSDSSAVVTPIPVTFTSGSVVSSSSVVTESGVNFLFTLNVPSYILKGALIYVLIPDGVTYLSEYEITQRCNEYSHSGFPYGTISCAFTTKLGASAWYVAIKDGFKNASTSADGPKITFTLPQMVNPRSTESSPSFQVFIYDQVTTYQLYNITSGLSVSVSKAATMQSLVVTPSNYTNGAVGSYTWLLKLKSYALNGDYLILNLPTGSSMVFNANYNEPVCNGVSWQLYPTLTCSMINSTSLKVTLGIVGGRRLQEENNQEGTQSRSRRNLAIQLQTIQFTTTNVLNPPSLKPTSSFQISLYNSNGYIIEQLISGATIQNKVPSTLTSSQVLIIPNSMNSGAITSYMVTMVPNNYQYGMILYIQLPTEISIVNGSTLNCTAYQGLSSNIDCSTYNATSKIITVKKAFNSTIAPSTPIQFSINSLQNPLEILQTQSFKINTYTSDGYWLDSISSGVQINFVCSLPCKTCTLGSNKACSSCYTDMTTTYLPHLYNQYCFSSCPTGTYSDSEQVCQACASSECATCSGPGADQCKSCTKGTTLTNGKCIKDFTATYFFPFLIASIVWLLATFCVMSVWPATHYIASAIAGVGICEYMLTFLQVAMYNYFNYTSSAVATVIVGIVLLYAVNIVLVALYFTVLAKQQQVKKHRASHLKSHLFLLIGSLLFTNRIFKFLYSHFSGKDNISLSQLITIRKNKIAIMVVSYLSLIPSVGMIAISAANLAQIKTQLINSSWSKQQEFTRRIDIERIIISSILVFLILIEFIDRCTRNRPTFIRRLIDEEQHYSASKQKRRTYNSYNSQEDENEQGANSKKKKALQKLMAFDNFKKAQVTMDETFIVGADNTNTSITNKHRRRMSDPPKFSHDNVKSVHYMSNIKQNQKAIQDSSFVTKSGLLNEGYSQRDNISEGDENSALSYPLTPRRRKIYDNRDNQQRNGVNNSMIHPNNSFANFMNEESFMVLKNKKVAERHSEIKTMMEKITTEKKQIAELNEQLKSQRLMLGKEKEEIIKMRQEGSMTTRQPHTGDKLNQDLQFLEEEQKRKNQGTLTSRSIQKDLSNESLSQNSKKKQLSRTMSVENKLSRSISPAKDKLNKTLSDISSKKKLSSRDNKLDIQSSKSSRRDKSGVSSLGSSPRKKNLRNTSKKNLDEVRESQSELLDDLDLIRGINKKGNISSRKSQIRSQKNLLNDTSRSSLSPHKCHGHSKETVKSVHRLRSQDERSFNSSFVGSKHPSKALLQMNGTADFTSNNSQSVKKTHNSNKFLKRNASNNNNTKIYYSDKSESSVEELMDETPSNYNLANGRFEGNSRGLRQLAAKQKASSPAKFSNLISSGNNIADVHLKDNLSSMMLPPKKSKKKFRNSPNKVASQNDIQHSFLNNNSSFRNNAQPSQHNNELLNNQSPFGMQSIHNISEITPNNLNGMMDQSSRNFNGQPFYGMGDSSFDRGNMSQLGGYTVEEIHKKKKYGKKGNKKKGNVTLNSSEQSHRTTAFNPSRVKALEVAYLTKLVPNKSTSKLVSQHATHTTLPQIAIDVRHDNYTPDMASKQNQQLKQNKFAKVNNYQGDQPL